MTPLEILSFQFSRLELVVPKPRGTHDPVIAGVYVLVDGDQIVYVGSSFHICARIRTHLSEAGIGRSYSKRFDRVIYMELPRRLADIYEAALVRFLEPRNNARGWVHRDRSADAEVLYGLGLCESLAIEDVQWEPIQ